MPGAVPGSLSTHPAREYGPLFRAVAAAAPAGISTYRRATVRSAA